jgi:N-methylhydantoinase A/oxoprolinase/acetone carboxylase beta subunit
VETILSGPAASVSGAQHLTGIDDALVVDMGGTTTDTAALEGGTVDISEAGASVGGYRTHVRALAIRTAGLGGDSLIRRDLSDFVIGPRRVAPVAWTALHHTGTAEAFDFVERHMDRFKAGAANAMQLLLLTGELPPDLTPAASRAASLLAERPFTVAELVERTGAAFEGALEIGALEEKGIVTRSGPTPMDLLHFTGRFTAWDRAAAERYLGLLARAAGQEPVEMVEGLLQTITRRMTLELLKRQMDEVTDDPEALHRCPACGALLANLFAGGSRHFTVAVQLKRPIIGIGAPVGYFLPQAAALLNTGLVIPEHADVANAIGAITSRVAVTRRLRVVAAPDRTFAVQGLAGLHRFGSLDGADRFAREALTRLVTEGGLSAGTRSGTVSLAAEDRTLTAQDGTDLFKWRTITARLIGPPDLSLANPTAASGQKRASTAVVQEVPVDDAR